MPVPTAPGAPIRSDGAAEAAAPEAEAEPIEVVDLEAALGGGIRKAPAIVAALEEAEAAESGY